MDLLTNVPRLRAIIRSQDDGAALRECRVLPENSNDNAAQRRCGDAFIASIQVMKAHFSLAPGSRKLAINKSRREIDGQLARPDHVAASFQFSLHEMLNRDIKAPSKFIRASRVNALSAGEWETGGSDFNDQSQPASNPGRCRSKQRTYSFHTY